MKRAILVTMGALIAVCFAFAMHTIVADIGFPFTAGAKSFQAGKYTVEIEDPDVIAISGPGGREVLVVLTRLGRRGNDTSAELVFDKVGDKSMLSEIWPAGGADGYLILSTKEAHTHAVVGGSKK